MARKYTRKQLVEAIAYWKNKLRTIDEADETDDTGDKEAGKEADTASEGGDKDLAVSEETVEKKAEANPIGVFDISARMHRLHNGARNKVRKELGSFLTKFKMGNVGTVMVENSCDVDGYFEMPKEGDKMVVTVKVEVEKAKVKGFHKMIALMKENDKELMKEGFLKDLWTGIKMTGSAMAKTAKEKIDVANEKLKKNIGLAAIKRYVEAFCGKALAEKVSLKNVMIGQSEEGDGAQITFAAALNIK